MGFEGLDAGPYVEFLRQPAGDPLGRPKELAEHPDAIEPLILDRAREAADRIRTAAQALGHYATVVKELADNYPEVVSALPPGQQEAIKRLAGLIDPDAKMPERPEIPITIKVVGGESR
jgi:hypothetical protein